MKRFTRRRATLALAAIPALCLSLMADACSSDSGSGSTAQVTQNSLGGTIATEFAAAKPYPYKDAAPTDPLERINLAARLIQLNSKGSTGYVYVFAPMSKDVVGYYVTRGKVSSTGSQMTSTQMNVNCSDLVSGSGGQACTVDSPGDDGSWGPSEGGPNGVFWFTSTGILIESVLPWLWSSQPIKLYANAPQLG